MKKIFNINSLIFFSLFFIFLLPPTDPDLGWQIRCGAEFFKNHTFCNINQFTVLLPEYSWPNHYWLYQAVIFPIYQLSGLWGLTFFNGFIMALAFFFFYLGIKNFFLEKLLAISLTIFFGWGVFSLGIRSQEMSFFFFSILLFIASKIRQNPAIAVFCPLITLLWANMHGGSVILGVYLLLFILFSSPVKKIGLISLICLFSFLMTFLNPFGLAIYQDAWRHFNGQIDLSKIIAEWVPAAPIFNWLIVLNLGLFLLTLLRFFSFKNLLLLIFLLPLSFWAIRARRNLPFYWLFYSYLLLNLPSLKSFLSHWLEKDFLRNYLAFLIISCFLLVGLFRLPLTVSHLSSWQNYCDRSSVVYPCQAIEFLKKQPANQQTNIFNRYEWGGFLIWQLPEYKIFVDGRMAAWTINKPTETVSPYTVYLETLQNQPGWQKTLNDYKIGWIFISPNTFMDLLLREDPAKFGWQEAYRDKIAIIYEKIK